MDDIFFDARQDEEEVYSDAQERLDIYFHNPVDYENSTIRDMVLNNYELTEPSHEWGRCRNPHCNVTLNRTFSLECVCESVFYCSSICLQADENHWQQCTHNKNNTKYTDTSCKAIMRTRVGPSTITVKGDFEGVKKGDKFIRGKFSWTTGIKMLDDTFFIASYIGEMTTVKINGHIVLLPHGKGALKIIELTTIGNFVNGTSGGECDFYHYTNITYKAEVKDGVPVGIYEIYSEQTCMYVDESIWHIVRTLSVKTLFSGWKKSDHAMILDIKDDMKPRIVEKREVEGMEVRRVIYQEKLHNTGFRCCVMGNIGDDSDIYIVMSATTGCMEHGTYHYSPTCMKAGGTMMDKNIVMECTCPTKYESIVDESCIEVNITPSVKPLKSHRADKSPTKIKDRGVRGVSGRDMSKNRKDMTDFSIDGALEDGGWELKRQTNHLVYTRIQDDKKQTFVTSKTPSCDIRRRALSTLSVF